VENNSLLTSLLDLQQGRLPPSPVWPVSESARRRVMIASIKNEVFD